MDAIEPIVGKAQDLGDAIAAHSACVAMKAALETFRADEAAQKLEADYADAARTLEAKSAAGEPLEPEDKKREVELRDQMVANEVMKNFLRAQADFQALMQTTNATLQSAIGLD